jgi:class 3 adenylate cyclase
MVDTLVSGRQAIQRHAWGEAWEAFTEADEAEHLSPKDLELLAEAAWWSGQPDEAVEALERAFAGYLEEGQPSAAALLGLRLAYLAFRRLALSIAAGWLARSERLLEHEPESVVHGWLEVMHTAFAFFGQADLDEAIGRADQALELGRKYGSPDVQSMALSFKGSALIDKGQWQEGLALIDEASAAAMSGELDLRSASDVYCMTIAACRNLADYRRAGEWTDEAERWMRRQAVGGYPGVCRVHRAELKRLRGAWSEAEQEARHACQELEKFHIMDAVGFAHYEVGEVRLRMGDLAAAEEAFDRAYEYGRDAQPGLALLLMARGDVEGAATSIARSLGAGTVEGVGMDEPRDILSRARILPAQVEIALAAGDLETARAATEELEEVARQFQSPALEAAALTARGAVLLQDGEPAEAVRALDRAWRLWREIELPYEGARARLLLGQARAAAGDDSSARLELRAARSAFQQLGATLDLRRVGELLEEEAVADGERRRMTKTFMFTDIVTSTDLVGLIGDAAWEELLRWHDRALRSAFAHHGGEEVSHTGDGFFVAFDQAREAVECAVAIQRRLADHRREHGFAPWVRIGLHAAEATRQGSDYRGQGVHAAARVGALADREEIVTSASALEQAGVIRFPVSEPREVTLKGVGEPIEVHTIDWR